MGILNAILSCGALKESAILVDIYSVIGDSVTPSVVDSVGVEINDYNSLREIKVIWWDQYAPVAYIFLKLILHIIQS